MWDSIFFKFNEKQKDKNENENKNKNKNNNKDINILRSKQIPFKIIMSYSWMVKFKTCLFLDLSSSLL